MHDFLRSDKEPKPDPQNPDLSSAPNSPNSPEANADFLEIFGVGPAKGEALHRASTPLPPAPAQSPFKAAPEDFVEAPLPGQSPAPRESPAPAAVPPEEIARKKKTLAGPPKTPKRKRRAGRKGVARPADKPMSRLWWCGFAAYLVGIVIYFAFIAKDRYTSVSQFAVTRGGTVATGTDDALSFITGSSQGGQDAHTAIAYIQSVDMLRWIEEETNLDIRTHFADAGLDFIHRLKPGSSIESAHGFFKDRVSASFGDTEGLVTLEIEGFDPTFAQELSAAVLSRTEDYLNELNRDIAEQSTVFLMEDLAIGEEKLNSARESLIEFQNDNLTVDPEADLRGRLELIQSLKKEKVYSQAEQLRLRRESPNSPHIALLESQIASMDGEIERESKALTGEGPDTLNKLLAVYARLNQNLEFASQRYLQNLALVEEIRLQTLSQHRYLSVVQNPYLPEDASRPNRLYWIISFAVMGLLGMQILRLSIRTVADHG